MNFRKSCTVWSLMLIILASNVNVEAAKATRRGGNKSKPNYDAISLSYGGSRTGTNRQQPATQHQVHQTQQAYQPKPVAPAPSAPNLPNSGNNRPIGWNVPNSNSAVQQKTVSNTNTGFQPQPQPQPHVPGK